ncbi:signal transduction histidine kinase/ligand-binding sensor domain-containing protein/DNA-binding response OmpR family regulator [Parabacteroides sp. PF5-5]|uniref:hybrid sensor histidine kinase/response regulator transcription factor n=1 Tax=unclassified Parabacteroides TaxID=2649774 RepID=UPI0024732793|nr:MULTISPECIES: two-component regulator propeller domain-containing protein [unclassified Parabacteroides]MDH6303419.1 signal transduction histidine kinase/ligand-binding sensor domain-containing protein/DNA-binding response OmpR family regulator [Parabacteroides sp. PH5-39]MDH6314742.1 signal transduction histidine kinase/ligand-binding sensor domain-containing protein/DNA-binding response OmpR family regulator [Parabacteroides sp. PF5-13]MDH6318079.1 signal transduction histidine kinase/ligan
MKQHLLYKFILLFCGLYFFSGAIAALEENILFNRIDVNNGLPSNEISCILKDKKGFMWFGTGAGLIRYDGYEFKTFRHEINGSLFSEGYIIQLTETIDGKLWVTYQNGEISIFDLHKNTFHTIEDMQKTLAIQPTVTAVFQDIDYQLLFRTSDNKLCRYDFETKKVTDYPAFQKEGGVCNIVQKDGCLYVIYYSGLIEIVHLEKTEYAIKNDFLQSFPIPKRFNMFVDSGNDIWIYMDPENHNGLFHYQPKTREWQHYTTESAIPLTSSLIRDVKEDPKGNIWIATDHGGINILNKQKETIRYIKSDPLDPKSISQNSVICLYKDDTDILWCGTYKSGINYYHKSIFKFNNIRYPIIRAEDAATNDCNCVYEDTSGNLWIGTNGNGLLHYNRITKQYRKYQHNPADPGSISSNIIVCLTGDAEGNLWIGTYMGGLDCFNGKTFTHHQPAEGKLSNSSIYSLLTDENNNLWIGTLGGGVNQLNLKSKQWKHFSASNDSNPLLSDEVYSISAGNPNELLIGTALGVNIINTRSGKVSAFLGTRDNRYTFKDKAINTVFLDKHKLMWVGSNNGLSIYDQTNDKLYHLDKTNQLPDNDVTSIMQDDYGILWLGTKNCLLKIAPQYNEESKQYTFDCTTYYENEGISGRIFNRNSRCRTSDGEFIFGGTNGLTTFNPMQIHYNTNPPQVVFTGLQLQNQQILPGKEYNENIILSDEISYTKELSLKYEERGFSLSISALNYFLPGKTKYAFFMEGHDKNWTTIDASNRNITYTNLPAGSYIFLVKAENNDGVWSDTPSRLNIKIQPPFWATPWAVILYLLLSISLILLIVIIFSRFQKRKFVKEQERIAANRLHEMDEMKLRFFTNVSHEFRTPLTLIIAPVEKLMKGEHNSDNKKILQLVHENATQLLSLVNQLLDFRKIDVQGVDLLLSSGDIVIFIRNISYSFKDLSEQKNIRYSFSTAIPSFMMKFDTDKIFKIVSNLLSNAFKFTPEGGEIAVNLQVHNREGQTDELCIQISDTGIGIPEDKQELIFNRFYQIPPENEANATIGTGIGLHICREFVKMHNGTITVKSELGKGSTFTVSLPVILSEIEEIISVPHTVEAEREENTEARISSNNLENTILIVDDNSKFREFMRLSLNDNFNILTASDGEEAWQVILDHLPDMVISDVMMPITDGIVLCKRIKEDIRTSHIPVILLTAKSAEASKLTGLEAGADDYIGKPFNMDVLILKIRHIIDMKNRMREQFSQATNKGIQLTSMDINSLDEELMKKAIQFIEEQIANPELSVEWLSREMGMSRVNFYKKTMSITGKTPVELIRTIRMKHAAILLEKSQMRVSEVAFKVGINDSKLFRKYFKEEFGILPSDYIENKK